MCLCGQNGSRSVLSSGVGEKTIILLSERMVPPVCLFTGIKIAVD